MLPQAVYQLFGPHDYRQRVEEYQFLSKYRGIVSKVRIQDGMPWVRATVPTLGGVYWESNWARPCLAGAYGYAEKPEPEEWRKSGTWFTPRPAPGDGVWIEFEHGNKNYPIWSGFWYLQHRMPTIFTNVEYLGDLPWGGTLDKTQWQKYEGTKQCPPEDAPPVPKTVGIKLHGFFMLIHYVKKHLRLHTPRRQYILLNDKDLRPLPRTKEELGITIHSEGRIELVEDARYNVPHGPLILAKYNAHQHCDIPGALGTPPCTNQWIFLTDLSQTVFSDTAPRRPGIVTVPQDDGSEDTCA